MVGARRWLWFVALYVASLATFAVACASMRQAITWAQHLL